MTEMDRGWFRPAWRARVMGISRNDAIAHAQALALRFWRIESSMVRAGPRCSTFIQRRRDHWIQSRRDGFSTLEQIGWTVTATVRLAPNTRALWLGELRLRVP